MSNKRGHTAVPGSEIFTKEEANKNFTGLIDVIIPDTISVIGKSAFYGFTELRNVRLPRGLKRIEASAFGDCKGLKKIVIPDSVEFIGPYAFYYSGLEEVRLPQGLREINPYTFAHCFELKKVDIPESVEYVSCCAFTDCTSLAEVEYSPHLVKVGSGREEYKAYIDKAFIETGENEKAILKQWPQLKKAYKFMINTIKNNPSICMMSRPMTAQEEKALVDFIRTKYNKELPDDYIALLRLRNGWDFVRPRLCSSYEIIERNKDTRVNADVMDIDIGWGHHGVDCSYFAYPKGCGYRLDYDKPLTFSTLKEMLGHMMLSEFYIEEDYDYENMTGRY